MMLIGDSIMDDQMGTCDGFAADGVTAVQKQGWAGDIGQYFNDDITLIHHGHSGNTMQMFIEGRKNLSGHTGLCSWDNVKSGVGANDYVIISMYGNDENRLTGARFDDVKSDQTYFTGTTDGSYWERRYLGADGIKGTSDDRQFSADQLKGWYKEIIDECLEKGTKVLLVSRPPKTSDFDSSTGKFKRAASTNVEGVIDLVRATYSSNQNVEFIDMSQYYADALNALIAEGETGASMLATKIPEGQTNAGKYITGSIFVDYSHLTARGAALYAEILAEKIGELNNFGLASYLKTDKAKVVLVGGSMVDGVQNAQTGTADKAGWGAYIADYLDTSKIEVANHGHNGTSIQMFVEGGRFIGNPNHRCGWEYIKEAEELGAGDYVIITSSTNDETRLDGYGFDDVVKSNGVVTEIKTTSTQNYWLRKYYGEDGVIDTVEEHNKGSIDDRQFTKEQFVEMYDSFIADATGIGIKVILLSTPPKGEDVQGDKFTGMRITDSVDAMEMVAAKYQSNANVEYIDMSQIFIDTLNAYVSNNTAGDTAATMIATKNNDNTWTTGTFYVDSTHFTAKAADMFAKTLAAELEKSAMFSRFVK